MAAVTACLVQELVHYPNAILELKLEPQPDQDGNRVAARERPHAALLATHPRTIRCPKVQEDLQVLCQAQLGMQRPA